MWQLFIGSLLLSTIHALIPHHWIPVVAIARSEKWTMRESVMASLVTGFSHMISTIAIGIVVGFVGLKLSESYSVVMRVAAPLILLAIGLVYLAMGFKSSHHHHSAPSNTTGKRSKTALLGSLCLAMFLTPCIEIEAYYFQAATHGWAGILTVSAVYLVLTLGLLSLLTYLALKGVKRLRLEAFEHHAKKITGFILVLLGVIAYFIEF